ncbi:hypothetical protein GDO81_022366 [Engystomops pustulosus]|uniref:Pentraxin family member n=1 Tax=Engystomops pustulosus TaxID=76066 RepID=A0AAV6Z4K8_ENGPU|nr:hypothetical protein GDO81_022366 [Engystomops pustulosus]
MWLWMMLWVSGALSQENMREKLFSFPEESNTSYVQIFPDRKGPFTEASVCMRFRSDVTREYSLFSLADPSYPYDFLLYYYPVSSQQILLYVRNTQETFNLQDDNFAEWTSLCVSWRSSGLVLFINGKTYKDDKTWTTEISADPIIIIGQLQQSYGRGFFKSQSFVGEMTDVNMWDKALTDEDMMDYFADEEMSGNIIDWKALKFTDFGNVDILPYSDPYPCEAI